MTVPKILTHYSHIIRFHKTFVTTVSEIGSKGRVTGVFLVIVFGALQFLFGEVGTKLRLESSAADGS